MKINKFLLILSLMFFLVVSFVSATIDNTDLVAYYSFNNNFDDEFASYDMSAGGTIVSGGVLSNNAYFNGINQYSSDTNTIYQSTSLTVSFWLKPTDVTPTSEERFISENGGSGYLSSKSLPNGTSQVCFYDVSSKCVYFNPVQDEWTHIVMTFDGSTINGYVNGVEYLSDSWAGFGGTVSGLVLGASRAKTANFYDGGIDELAVFDVKITTQQVLDLYNTGSGCNPNTDTCTASPVYPSEVTDIVFSPFTIYAVDDVSATVTVNDTTDADIVYYWLVNDVNISSGTVTTPSGNDFSVPLLDESNYDNDDIVKLVTHVINESDSSVLSDDYFETITVTDVTVTDVTITPSTIYTDNNAVGSVTLDYYTSVSVYYEWKVNDVSKSTGTVSTNTLGVYAIPSLSSSLFVQGDTIKLEATPRDSGATAIGDLSFSTKVVTNRDPVVNDVSFSPTTVTEVDDFNIYCDVSDIDGDNVNITWSLTKNAGGFDSGSYNNVVSGTNQLITTVDSADTSTSDVFELTCSISDGFGGSDSLSDSVTIQSARVTLSGVDWNDLSVYTLDDVSVSYTPSGNIAGDYFTINIYKNSVLFDSSTDSYTLSNTDTIQDDQFYFTVTAFDSGDNQVSTVYTSSTITILNNAPTGSSLAFSPNPPINNNPFTIKVTPLDLDGDNVNITWNLFKNSVLYDSGSVLNTASNVATNLNTVSAGNVVTDDTYYFKVNITDSFDTSTEYTSDTVTVISVNNFTISGSDSWDNSTINDFNATINGVNYSSDVGVISTDILRSSGDIVNITLFSNDYFNLTYNNYNVSDNLEAVFYQSVIDFQALEIITGDIINDSNFSVTDGITTNIYTDSSTAGLKAGNYNITFFKDGWFNKSSSFLVNVFDNKTVSVSDVSETVINITVNHFYTGLSINNFSGYVYNDDYDVNISFSTTSGYALVSSAVNQSFDIYIESDTYAGLSDTIYVNTSPVFYYDTDLFRYNSFYVTFRDEDDNTLITNVSLDLISDIFGNNYTTTNGTIYVTALSPEEYILKYYANNYTTRFYYLEVTDNSYFNLTLYLNEEGSGTDTTIIVYDTSSSSNLEGAIVKLLRYDITTNSYKVVQMGTTDGDGEVIFDILQDEEFYKFVIEYEGEVVKITNPLPIEKSIIKIPVTIGDNYLSDYGIYKNIYHTLVFNGDTNNFRFDFTDPSGIEREYCLYLYKKEYSQTTLINSSCLDTSSGSILLPVERINGTTYTAYGKVTINDYIVNLDEEWVIFKQDAFGNSGLLVQLLLTIIFLSAGFIAVELIPIAVPLSIIVGGLFYLHSISLIYTVPLLVLGIILSFVVNKNG